MNDANFKLAAQLIDKAYVDQARQARRVTEQLLKNLLAQRAIPEQGWDDSSVELVLRELAAMDSNNFPGNVGVGEREARIYSKLVASRNFGLGHGIGRSGDVMAVQPKAAGSSLIVQLTNYMASHALRLAGFSNVKDCVVLPAATGMALTLTMIALRQQRPAATHVVWPRIDQKTCLKAIPTAGLTPLVVENTLEGDELRTDVEGVERAIQELGPERVLCILSTTSCFAPRAHDKVEELARLAQKHDVGHIVNNAYGVMSRSCMGAIAAAAASGRVDAVVQSTDKNFQVPVGGAIIATAKAPKTKQKGRRPASDGDRAQTPPQPPARRPDLCVEVSRVYPGRASGAPCLDLFITLLSMGVEGFRSALSERVECMEYLREKLVAVAAANGERMLATKHNTISMAITLNTFCAGGDRGATSMLGSMLFSRFVSGTRVVTTGGSKKVAGLQFAGYGAHADAYPEPYMTAAAAMGMRKAEVDTFVQRLQAVFDEFRKQHPAALPPAEPEPEPEPESQAAEVAEERRKGRAEVLMQ